MSDIPVKITPADGLIALIGGLRDGTFTREDFIAAGDASIDTGAFEPIEEAAWGAAYDLIAPLVDRIDLPKLGLFHKRTPAELRADADEAEAAGKTGKAERLREKADRIEAEED